MGEVFPKRKEENNEEGDVDSLFFTLQDSLKFQGFFLIDCFCLLMFIGAFNGVSRRVILNLIRVYNMKEEEFNENFPQYACRRNTLLLFKMEVIKEVRLCLCCLLSEITNVVYRISSSSKRSPTLKDVVRNETYKQIPTKLIRFSSLLQNFGLLLVVLPIDSSKRKQ